MKTTSTILCLLFSVALTAQVTNLPTVLQVNDEGENAFNVVPKQLSYDGSNRVYIRTADDQIAIYSNAFTPVKSFSITPTLDEYIVIGMERTVTVTVTGGELITEKLEIETWHDKNLLELYLNCTGYGCETTYNVPENWTEDDIKNYLENGENVWGDVDTIIATQPYPEGGTMFIWDMEAFYADGSENLNYWEATKYGKKYPRVFYLWQNGYLYYCANVYYRDESIYSERQTTYSYSEWSEMERTPHEYAITSGLPFINYDTDQIIFTDGASGNGLCLTQTLFNEDDKYEYLSFPKSDSEIVESNSPDEPICDNCYEDGETFTENKNFYSIPIYNGFNVMSEDGNTLQSISFPNGFQMIESVMAQIIQISDERYILCQGEMNDNATLLIYKINRSSVGASVEQVCSPIKVGAFPSIANRNQMITIQLSGDNAGNNQTNLQVVDMQGKVLNQQTIPAGQISTTIPAHRLSNGMNLIKITQGSKTIGTEKVIIK